ncbi:MAG: hypothetical protein EZS28_031449, partial [Streblomastix strix]
MLVESISTCGGCGFENDIDILNKIADISKCFIDIRNGKQTQLNFFIKPQPMLVKSPYESLGKLERHAMQWYTTHIDIDWDKKSYLRNSKKNDTSYEYLRNSTFIQKVKEFDGPLPFIDKRVGDKI